MIIQQWHAATTTRHSYTVTYQFLTDLQTFVWAQSCFEIFSSDFEQLTSQLRQYFRVSCMHLRNRNWAWQPKIFGHALHRTPLSKFLNLPLLTTATQMAYHIFIRRQINLQSFNSNTNNTHKSQDTVSEVPGSRFLGLSLGFGLKLFLIVHLQLELLFSNLLKLKLSATHHTL